MNEFEGALYLKLNQSLGAAAFIDIVRRCAVFLVAEPNQFGVLVGGYKSDFPQLRNDAVQERYGIEDAEQFRFTDDVIDEPITCVPVMESAPSELVESLSQTFETIELADGRMALVAGYYETPTEAVEPRVTHELYFTA